MLCLCKSFKIFFWFEIPTIEALHKGPPETSLRHCCHQSHRPTAEPWQDDPLHFLSIFFVISNVWFQLGSCLAE